jgi:hypothetical protein
MQQSGGGAMRALGAWAQWRSSQLWCWPRESAVGFAGGDVLAGELAAALIVPSTRGNPCRRARSGCRFDSAYLAVEIWRFDWSLARGARADVSWSVLRDVLDGEHVPPGWVMLGAIAPGDSDCGMAGVLGSAPLERSPGADARIC